MTSVLENFFRDDDRFNSILPGNAMLPAVNVSETDEAFVLEVAAPGMERKDFDVEVDKNVLNIRFKKEETKDTEEKNYTRKEYSYNAFARSFRLPENAKLEAVDATYNNGVLEISVPKFEATPSEKRAISIK
jgi:HSP20 family protein